SVNREDAPAARAGIEAFIDRVSALIETGALGTADGRLRIETAGALGALLAGAEATDLETRRQQATLSSSNVARPQTEHTSEAGTGRRSSLAERNTDR